MNHLQYRRSLGTAVLASSVLLACNEVPERRPPGAKPTLVAMAPANYAARPDSKLPAADPLDGIPASLALKQKVQLNANAHIPPQCYTKTIDAAGRVHNPCYTCHVSSRAPNFINDADLQHDYAFAPHALSNPWSNLFVDWRPEIATLGDAEILSYIRRSNYLDERGDVILARQLAHVPREWDFDDDGHWSGYDADARFEFDADGFDRGGDGSYSGWRAYAYYPAPGTFWPANGSFGDALIRLAAPFRQNEQGAFDAPTYKLNLAILEALIRRADVAIEASDETRCGVDLDRDGGLGTARRVVFAQASELGEAMSFVGKARLEQRAGGVQLAAGLFPVGTEFLHSLRYLDPTSRGVMPAARFKELRYARKHHWFSPKWLERRARTEAQAKLNSPAERRAFGGDLERGIDTGQGWRFQGFIEDAAGSLRPQSFEESVYCAGCHSGVGVTDDAIFSFGRKLDNAAFRGGWFHFTQRGLQGVPDRKLADGNSEYVAYLERNGAGDEFRQNGELSARFFERDGSLKSNMKARLRRDITSALLPSRARALALDKAYRRMVERQSYRLGRELVLDGARNVHREIREGTATGVIELQPAFWQPAPALEAATSN